jgi:4-hydroxy-2-oxoheptanedioate aldolase
MKNIRRAMKDGDVVVGVCCDISDPSAVEALGYAGWDYVIINAEGGTVSPFGAELENMIRAAYLADVVPVVKVPENNPAMIASALKMGAKIVEVPKVNSKADAERALKALHYAPRGERMTCWGVPATKYGAVSWAEHVQAANEDVSMYAVLEEQEAMDNMEEILSTEGLEMVILGALDLALRLGGVEDASALAQVRQYRGKLMRAARDAGVAVIEIVRNGSEAREAVEMGAQALLFGQDDLAMLRQASLNRLTELREAIKG